MCCAVQDVQWIDIDHMESHLDWTYDPLEYAHLPELVAGLHARGVRFVPIIDPGISDERPHYEPYQLGIKYDLFLKMPDGKNLVGIVRLPNSLILEFTYCSICMTMSILYSV